MDYQHALTEETFAATVAALNGEAAIEPEEGAPRHALTEEAFIQHMSRFDGLNLRETVNAAQEVAAQAAAGAFNAHWWSGTQVSASQSVLTMPDPSWTNADELYSTFDGRRCLTFAGEGGTAFSYNNASLANLFGLDGGTPVTLAFQVDYYWDRKSSGDTGAWWHFETTGADGESTPDRGFELLQHAGLVAGAWDSVTVRRENQALGVAGHDDWYFNIQAQESADVLYIGGISLTAEEADGTVHQCIWGAPLVSGAVEGDMYLNTATGAVYRYQAGRWLYQCSIPGVDGTISGGTF